MKHIKRIFSYAVHFKWMLGCACVLMLMAIVIDLVPTKITQQILDNYISGIYEPWIEVKEDDENTVEINDHYYIQPDYHQTSHLTKVNDMSIVEVDHHFYLVEGVSHVSEGTRSYDKATTSLKVTFQNETMTYQDVYELTTNEVISLYAPYYSAVVKLLLVLALMYLMSSIINYLNNYMYGRVSIELSTLLRFDMFDKMQKLPISYFQNEADGRIVSKITNDTDAVRNFFSTIISIIIEGVFGFIIIYFYMYTLNPKFAIMVLFVMPLIIFWIYMYRVFRYNLCETSQQSLYFCFF